MLNESMISRRALAPVSSSPFKDDGREAIRVGASDERLRGATTNQRWQGRGSTLTSATLANASRTWHRTISDAAPAFRDELGRVLHLLKVKVHAPFSDRNPPLTAVRTSPPELAFSMKARKPSSRETEYHVAQAFSLSLLATNPPTSLSRHDLRRYRFSMLVTPLSSC